MFQVRKRLNKDWYEILHEEFKKNYFMNMLQFLREIKRDETIYPPVENIFSALNQTSFNKVKVVIMGQDPYHSPNQANGLAFSVNKNIRVPPSLRNIYKELQSDIACNIPDHGDLSSWAKQGVLLLNATLTVTAGKAGSHQNKGWESFTDTIIKTLSQNKEHIVFILWGAYAKGKESLIDDTKHLILKAAHPSPLSANNGFFGCGHFSKANEYLKNHGMEEINWQLPLQQKQLF